MQSCPMLFPRLLNFIKSDEQKNENVIKQPKHKCVFTFVIIHQTHKSFIIEVLEDTPLHKILGQNNGRWGRGPLFFTNCSQE